MLNAFSGGNTVTALGQSSVADMPAPEPIEDDLALYVRTAFIEAENYRRISGVEERLLRALRTRRYEYDPEDRSILNGTDIYIGLTELKCAAAEAWINDVLLSSIDKPWELIASPIPDLPEWLKEQVVSALESELEQNQVPFDIRERAKQLKDAASKYATQKAQNAADGMEKLIESQLLEGGWRECFGELIQDFTTFPACFLRSPVIQNRKKIEWAGNKLVEKTETIYTSRRISPFDAYPSLESTNAQNGRYFIERLKQQPEDLYLCLGIEGFNEQAVREVIDKFKNTGYEEQLRPDYQRKHLQDSYTPTNTRKTVDTLIFNGKVPGSYLIDRDIIVPDAEEQYECEVWTANNRTIKALLNPYPLSGRPIFTSSYRKVPGALWGQGLADILRNVQRLVNSAARSVVRNMAYSSGPFGEVDVNRLGEGEIPNEVMPYKIFHVDPDMSGGSTPAFKFTIMPNITPMLMETMDKFYKMADDLSGVPAYVLGNPSVSGAGRTLGGLSMLMGNAAKGIKNSIFNVDKDIIEKMIHFYYLMNMMYDEDADIKADCRALSRGATGLLQRELAQTRTTEILQMITPYVQMGIVQPAGIQNMLREILKSTGINVDDVIPNPDTVSQQIQGAGAGAGADLQHTIAQLGRSPGMALNTGTNAPSPLDNRSQPAPSPGNSPLNMPLAGGPPQPTPTTLPVNMPTGS